MPQEVPTSSTKDLLQNSEIPDLQPFPPFPEDMLRLILEVAAESDRRTALKIILLARHVHDWIEPVLYREIIFNSNLTVQKFSNLIRSSQKPPSFFTDRVRSLSLPRFTFFPLQRHLLLVLRTCNGIQDLALSMFPSSQKGGAEILETLRTGGYDRLRRLRCYAADILEPSASPPNGTREVAPPPVLAPVLTNLVHLDISIQPRAPEQLIALGALLRHIPQLRYLFLRSAVVGFITKTNTIADDFPESLHVIILSLPVPSESLAQPDLSLEWMAHNSADPRVVFYSDHATSHYPQEIQDELVPKPENVDQWCYPLDGRSKSIWERAEEIVAKRSSRRNEAYTSQKPF